MRLLAAEQGEEENSLAARLLTELLTEDEADFAESVAALREGLADLEAGDRGMLLEDYHAQVKAKRRISETEAAE